MDRGGWQATVHRVAKSWAQLKWLSTHRDIKTWLDRSYIHLDYFVSCLLLGFLVSKVKNLPHQLLLLCHSFPEESQVPIILTSYYCLKRERYRSIGKKNRSYYTKIFLHYICSRFKICFNFNLNHYCKENSVLLIKVNIFNNGKTLKG